MSETEIVLERRTQSLVVRFNRPAKANALSLDMANQLFNILKVTTTDRSVRAVLLIGAGDNFMSGLDLDSLATDPATALERANQMILPYHSAIREMQTMDKPVIAAVTGRVTGPGLSLMLAADLVIGAETTVLNCDFSRHALSPDGACSYFLPRKIGAGKAMELMMLSRDFTASEAAQFGLIHKLVPANGNTLKDSAFAWLDELAVGPTKAYGAVKKLAMASFEQDLAKHLSMEHTFYGANSRSFDFKEALKAHTSGRAAVFTGT